MTFASWHCSASDALNTDLRTRVRKPPRRGLATHTLSPKLSDSLFQNSPACLQKLTPFVHRLYVTSFEICYDRVRFSELDQKVCCVIVASAVFLHLHGFQYIYIYILYIYRILLSRLLMNYVILENFLLFYCCYGLSTHFLYLLEPSRPNFSV